MKNIHINQLGYRPFDKKKAVISGENGDFKVIRITDNNSTVFEGKAGDAVYDAASGENVRIADFSSVAEKGEYFIINGENKSYPFIISDKPYSNVRKALLEMFNYQKCGVDLECGLWSHKACHATPAFIYGTDKTLDVSGGWHDAGDYGRYIVPAAKSAADLLLAYEFSANKDSALLDITWFEIEWMLKMQDGETGGVYHKVSCEKFDAIDEMPDEEKEKLVLCPCTVTASADFAATMALASRFYPKVKEKLLNAACRAWDWSIKNQDMPGFSNPEGISTGGYGDDNNKDEIFWAACELFAATKEDKYHDYIKNQIKNEPVYEKLPWAPHGRRLLSGLGWSNMGTYGVLSYLSQTNEKSDKDILNRMKNELLSDCEKIMEKYKANPYGISLGEFYPWGSNMIVANNAMMLIIGSKYALNDKTKIIEYNEAAIEHFHYLLGRNALSQSYVTGFGHNASRFPHHRPSAAKGSAVPGMLVGGPIARFDRDPAVKAFCSDAPPAKRYIDHTGSFSSNEITIYWNSPAYFVAAALDF